MPVSRRGKETRMSNVEPQIYDVVIVGGGPVGMGLAIDLAGAVRRMRTRIRLQAQPEPMRSIVGATQSKQTTRNL